MTSEVVLAEALICFFAASLYNDTRDLLVIICKIYKKERTQNHEVFYKFSLFAATSYGCRFC